MSGTIDAKVAEWEDVQAELASTTREACSAAFVGPGDETPTVRAVLEAAGKRPHPPDLRRP